MTKLPQIPVKRGNCGNCYNYVTCSRLRCLNCYVCLITTSQQYVDEIGNVIDGHYTIPIHIGILMVSTS